MTWSIVTKLLILVIFIVIICLPDFFTSYTVSKVNLLCLPCERDKRAKKRENWQNVEDEVKRKTSCDPPSIAGGEEWRERCDEREADSGPTSDDASSEEPHTSWYMCESQGSVAELYHNNSFSAANVHIEVSVKLQLGNSTFLKLTLSGHRNSSSLQLQPPEETDDGGCSVASYCCALVPPTSETSNHTVCLLRLSNYTVPPVAENKELLKTQADEWSAALRILWLVLLCVVLLTLSSAFLRKLKRSGHCCKKVHPLGYSFTGQQLKDGSNDKIKILKERNLHTCELRYSWSGLSTIQEVQGADDAETVLDGPVEHSYVTANLHHRPTVTFSLTEELSC